MRPSRRLTALLAALLVVAAFSGCGGGSGDGDGSTTAIAEEEVVGSPQLHLEADPDGDLAFVAEEAVASEGNVSFVIDNPTPRSHTVAVEDKRGKVLGKTRVAIRGSEFVTLSMDAGTYTYFCTVPGHRKAGMEGTVTVEPG